MTRLLPRYERALAAAGEVDGLHARALVMLGGAAVLEVRDHAPTRAVIEGHAEVLASLLARERRPDRGWFRILLGETMYRLPEALIRAGLVLDRADWVAVGLDTLDWIMVETDGETTTPVMRDACAAALAATGAPRWRSSSISVGPGGDSRDGYLAAA